MSSVLRLSTVASQQPARDVHVSAAERPKFFERQSTSDSEKKIMPTTCCHGQGFPASDVIGAADRHRLRWRTSTSTTTTTKCADGARTSAADRSMLQPAAATSSTEQMCSRAQNAGPWQTCKPLINYLICAQPLAPQ